MNDIKKERMLEIEEIVNGLLSGINFEKSPYVDIVSLVKKDNFEVKTETMDIDTTGYLVVNDNAEKLERNITVNTIFKNPDNETDVIFKKAVLLLRMNMDTLSYIKNLKIHFMRIEIPITGQSLWN